MKKREMTRRGFLARSALAVTAPTFVSAGALGKSGTVAPSERITLGVIGCGNRGLYDLGHFLQEPDVQCLAVCDCWQSRRQKGKGIVDDHHRNNNCKAHRFHEELLAREEIDTVLIATGDRWHAVMSILASRAGKDVYCEKPFCLTVAEGRKLVETTKRFGTIWQCGTQRRSNRSYRFVADTVRGGAIGELHTITMSFGGWGANGIAKPEPVPAGFDYDRWLGQAPWAPYSPVRVRHWRQHWDTGAGPIADMGPHFIDTAQWAHESEYSSAVEYEGDAQFPVGGFANVPFSVNVQACYADGVVIRMNSGNKGVRFDGEQGWIHIDDFGNITPKSMLRDLNVSGVSYHYMAGHVRNFLDCVRSRRQPVSGPEISHRSHTIAHCANLCLRLGRKLRWNPESERFVNDDDANRMLTRTMRMPWGV
jgi:predicted dehydrogenase